MGTGWGCGVTGMCGGNAELAEQEWEGGMMPGSGRSKGPVGQVYALSCKGTRVALRSPIICLFPFSGTLLRSARSRMGNVPAAGQKRDRNQTRPHPSLVRERWMGGLQASAYQKLLLKLISLSEPLVSRAT